MRTRNIWSKIQVISGWFALFLIVLSIVSGYGWDIRTSSLVSKLTSGLLNRRLSSDLHSGVVVILIITLILHIAPSVEKFYAKKKMN